MLADNVNTCVYCSGTGCFTSSKFLLLLAEVFITDKKYEQFNTAGI